VSRVQERQRKERREAEAMEEESKDRKGAGYSAATKVGRSTRSRRSWRHEALARGASGPKRTRIEQQQGMQEGVAPPCSG
jgi:hypothetical protein